MPRSPGPATGGIVTHVLNRSNARRPLFEHDGDLPEFMRWLTVTHTQRWHAAHGTAASGHVYQGRYKSFPVQARRITRAQRERGVIDAAVRC